MKINRLQNLIYKKLVSLPFINKKRWIWDSYGCSYYGFLALFLGFCQMHVPVIIMLDQHFERVDPDYEEDVKRRRRIIMVIVSFVISLFFGVMPLFTWTPMTYEPSYLSCSVYQAKPDWGYISYIWASLIVYEIIPLALVIWIVIISKKNKSDSKISIRVNAFYSLLI